MKADLLVKNGKVVSPTSIVEANIFVKDGKIIGITDSSVCGEAKQIIDAVGLYVIPGVVDPHVHMMDPGYTEREDFITGTRAAAYGGVTTVIEHHRTEPPVYSAKELGEKINYLSGRSVVDFSLMGGGNPENIDNLEAMWDKGVTSFKMFTCSLHHQPAMLLGNLFEALTRIKEFNGLALIHCEDDSLTTLGEELLKKQGRFDYLSHYDWRSVLAEEIAVEGVIQVAKKTGAQVVIAHVSSPHLLDKIKAARDSGYPIHSESCPHYFYLSTEDLKAKGPWVKFAPSVRHPEVVKEMWNKLNQGYVSYLGSDHCPFPVEVKQKGVDNIWEAPNGIPGVETSLRLMLNAVNQGLTTLNKVVELMCQNPAKIYGLYPQKGAIMTGGDADLVIIDMEKEDVLSNQKVVSKCSWTPYDGMRIKGVPEHVLLRGQIIVKNGTVIGEPGTGKFIPRLKDKAD